MTDVSLNPGDCACTDGLTFVFTYEETSPAFITLGCLDPKHWISSTNPLTPVQTTCNPINPEFVEPTAILFCIGCQSDIGPWRLTSFNRNIGGGLSPCGPPLAANFVSCDPFVLVFESFPNGNLCCDNFFGNWRLVITE